MITDIFDPARRYLTYENEIFRVVMSEYPDTFVHYVMMASHC